MMGLIEFWYDLPTILRIALGLLFIGISTAFFFFADRIWPWGWAVGAVMIFASGAGKNKGGYNF
jgi:hypothetical protein